MTKSKVLVEAPDGFIVLLSEKAPRSDDCGVWSNTPQGRAIDGNTADDPFMADQGDPGSAV